jgi:hypothetical protein
MGVDEDRNLVWMGGMSAGTTASAAIGPDNGRRWTHARSQSAFRSARMEQAVFQLEDGLITARRP